MLPTPTPTCRRDGYGECVTPSPHPSPSHPHPTPSVTPSAVLPSVTPSPLLPNTGDGTGGTMLLMLVLLGVLLVVGGVWVMWGPFRQHRRPPLDGE